MTDPLNGRGERTRGSAGISVVMLTPVVLALLAFAVLAGRVGTAHQDVVTAAHAARAASLYGTGARAEAAATTAAESTLRGTGMACASTTVEVEAGSGHPGGQVTVRVSCTVKVSDLVDLSLPGQKVVSATATAPVDTYRGGS